MQSYMSLPGDRPTVDALSSGQITATGLMSMLPLFMQQTMLASAMAGQAQPPTTSKKNGSGADAGGAAGSQGSKGSQGGSQETSGTSGGGQSSSMIELLIAKMFGADEDDELKGLRKSLTRERLLRENNLEKLKTRQQMRAIRRAEKEAALKDREATRAQGEEWRQRSKRNGPGRRGEIEIDEDQITRLERQAPRSREEREAEYNRQASKRSRKKHADNLGLDDRTLDYVDTNMSVKEYGKKLEKRRQEEMAAEIQRRVAQEIKTEAKAKAEARGRQMAREWLLGSV